MFWTGREACLTLKEQPLKKKLCAITIDKGMALGYEAICADGKCIGHTTSANTAYSLGRFLSYGYLPSEYADVVTKLEVEYLGKKQPATVVAEPLYEPKKEKLLA